MCSLDFVVVVVVVVVSPTDVKLYVNKNFVINRIKIATW